MANDADDEAIAIKVGGPIVAVPPIVFNGACKMGVKIRCEKAATTAGLTLSPIFTTQPNIIIPGRPKKVRRDCGCKMCGKFDGIVIPRHSITVRPSS